MPDKIFFSRKENLVIKDFESAFKCYEHLGSKVAAIRQWTVTMMIALMGFFLINHISVLNMFILAGSCLASFLLFELRERSSMKFDKGEIISLEETFMISDNEEYAKRIKEYEFRDLRLARFSRKKKCDHLFKSIKKPEVVIWYSSWAFIWILVIWTTNSDLLPNTKKVQNNNKIESVTKENAPLNQVKQIKAK